MPGGDIDLATWRIVPAIINLQGYPVVLAIDRHQKHRLRRHVMAAFDESVRTAGAGRAALRLR